MLSRMRVSFLVLLCLAALLCVSILAPAFGAPEEVSVVSLGKKLSRTLKIAKRADKNAKLALAGLRHQAAKAQQAPRAPRGRAGPSVQRVTRVTRASRMTLPAAACREHPAPPARRECRDRRAAPARPDRRVCRDRRAATGHPERRAPRRSGSTCPLKTGPLRTRRWDPSRSGSTAAGTPLTDSSRCPSRKAPVACSSPASSPKATPPARRFRSPPAPPCLQAGSLRSAWTSPIPATPAASSTGWAAPWCCTTV